MDYYESAETIAGNAAIQPFFAYPIQMSALDDTLVALIAKTLGVAKRDVTIAGGASSRNKIVEVAGVGPEAILELAG